jgi:hypothetical protein
VKHDRTVAVAIPLNIVKAFICFSPLRRLRLVPRN